MIYSYFLLLLLMWASTLSAEGLVIGHITDLTCPSGHYDLTRQKTPLPIKLFMELQAGDLLALNREKPLLLSGAKGITTSQFPWKVTDPNTQLLCKRGLFTIDPNRPDGVLQVGDTVNINPTATILAVDLNGNPETAVRYNQLAYKVPAAEPTPTIFGNIREQVGSWMTRQHDDQLKVLVGRGGTVDKPVVPLLEKSPPQQLVAGQRQLFIAWRSGTPPFRVTVTGHEQSQSSRPLYERQVFIPMTLIPGSYRLLIKDKNEQQIGYSFTVVDTPAPSLPFRKLLPVEKSLGFPLQMMCLAIQDNGIWQFEAVQQLAKSSSSLEKLLQESLLRGVDIPPTVLSSEECVK